MNKLCTKCKQNESALKESWCRFCRNEYTKKYRSENKDKIKQLNKAWCEKNKELCKVKHYEKYCTVNGRMGELVSRAKRRATKRKLQFDLNREFLIKQWFLQNGKCAVTGLNLEIPQERTGGKASPYSPSIDRIDSTQGYIRSNVRLVCYVVNCSLHDYGIHVFDKIAMAYINRFIDSCQNENKKELVNLSKKQLLDKKYRESEKGTITALFNQSKKNAKERNKEFSLTKNEIAQLLKTKLCSLTGISFDYKLVNENSKSNPFRPSLDRINPNKGYNYDNVRLVCVAVNYCLNEFGEEVFRNICTTYLENKNGSKILESTDSSVG